MIRLPVLFLALVLPALAAASNEHPQVLITGHGKSEAAPHGQGNVYAPCVLFEGGKWRMWYGGQGEDGHDRICYAESIKGRDWTKLGVVLEDKTANHVNDPSVVKVGETYFMYYTRAETFVIDRIHVATSTDGVTWKPLGVAVDAGPQGAWDSLSVGRPAVIYDGGLFKMWYDGRKDFPPGTPVEGVPVSQDSHRYVGYATSEDGRKWSRQGDMPVFGNDAGGVDVKRIGDGYVLLYESHAGTRFARSQDGVQWQDAGWLIRNSGSTIDQYGHVTPFLFIAESQEEMRLFFGAAPAASWDRNQIAVLSLDVEAVE